MDYYGWWTKMSKRPVTDALDNIQNNFSQSMNQYLRGKYGLISNPVGHIIFMAFIGSAGYLLTSVVLGSTNQEFDKGE